MNSGLLNSAEFGYFRDDIATVSLEVLDFDQNLLRYEYFLKLYSECLELLGEQFLFDMSLMFSAESRQEAYFLYFGIYYQGSLGYYAGYFANPVGQRSIYDTLLDIWGNELYKRITYSHGFHGVPDPRTNTYIPGPVADPTTPGTGTPPPICAVPVLTKGGTTANAGVAGYAGVVTITCATPGATTYYRINFLTAQGPWIAASSIAISPNNFLEAYATAEGFSDSGIVAYNNALVGGGAGTGGGGGGGGFTPGPGHGPLLEH